MSPSSSARADAVASGALEPAAAGVLIIGAGHAGVECAWALRAARYEGAITLVGEEPHLPYERPPLSKGLLLGATSADRIALRAEQAYASQGVQWMRGEQVVALDVQARCAHTASGLRLLYTHCVIATGAQARPLSALHGPNVHAVRTQADAAALRASLKPGARLLVVGGGYLGLEAACSAASLGARVTVLEQSQSLMGDRVSAHTCEALGALHRDAGVTWETGCAVARWEAIGAGWRAHTTRGTVLEADAVLVAIGAQPDDGLARLAGIACDDGVLVDDECRTSTPEVYAIGDCAAAYRPELGRRARVESVHNALVQARAAAAAIVGKPPAPRRAPTFWSEQLGRRLQMAGLVRPSVACRDEVTHTSKGWLVQRYQDNVLVAIEAVDSPAEFVKSVARIGTPAP